MDRATISFLFFKKGEIQPCLNVSEKNPEEKEMLKIMEGKGIIHNVRLMSRCVDRTMSSLFRERECICRLVCGFDVRRVREFLLDGICFLCKGRKNIF